MAAFEKARGVKLSMTAAGPAHEVSQHVSAGAMGTEAGVDALGGGRGEQGFERLDDRRQNRPSTSEEGKIEKPGRRGSERKRGKEDSDALS